MSDMFVCLFLFVFVPLFLLFVFVWFVVFLVCFFGGRILPRRIRVWRSGDLKSGVRTPKGQNGTFWVGRVSGPKSDQNGLGSVVTC